MNLFQKIFLGLFLFFVSFFLFFAAKAEDASMAVTPAVIDLKAHSREHLKESIMLTNEKNYKVNLYAFVNNISPIAGVQPFFAASAAELETSLANWINFPRGVTELSSGESRKIDFEIEVSPRAIPGTYHALIAFGEGATRVEAEKGGLNSGLTINLEVLDNAKELLEIRSFVPDKVFFGHAPATFIVSLKNAGNRAIRPEGELRIYARNGAEVGAVLLNELKDIAPGDTYESSLVFKDIKRYGRYKAILVLNYGQEKTSQDIVFFWLIPLRAAVFAFGAILSLGTLITVAVYSRYEQKQKT